MTSFLGIDPGVSGAICALIDGAEAPAFYDMPTFQTKTGAKSSPTIKNHIDAVKLGRLIRNLRVLADNSIYAILELTAMRASVRPMPPFINGKPHFCSTCRSVHMTVNQGMSNQGNFMRGGGVIVGVLAALEIPYEEVPSNVWTAEVFNRRTEKIDHRLLAQQMYPKAAPMLARVKDDGRADALLLADYGKRRHEAPF